MKKEVSLVRTTIRLPEPLWRKVKQAALDANTTAQKIITDMVENLK